MRPESPNRLAELQLARAFAIDRYTVARCTTRRRQLESRIRELSRQIAEILPGQRKQKKSPVL